MSETPGVTRWRKKPVEVDAVQWTGGNYTEIAEFTGHGGFAVLGEEDRANSDDPDCSASVFDKLHSTWVLVKDGQWIIRGVKGEFYPCADDVFRETYEPVGDPAGGKTPAEMLAESANQANALLAEAHKTLGEVAAERDRLAAALRRLASGDWLGSDDYGEELDYWRGYAADVLESVAVHMGPPSAATNLDPGVLADLLSLVGVTVTAGDVGQWTPEQREAARDWAAREHLHASDNPVERRPKPSFLDGAEGRR